MKVETVVRFRDLKAGCIREVGEQFTVSKERYKELEKAGVAKEVKESEETAAKQAVIFMPEGTKLHRDTGITTEM